MKNSYTATAKALHWTMALILFGMLALGFYMSDLPLSPQKLQLYSWHKWAGVSLFLLVLVRLSWRLGNRPPPLPAAMSNKMQYAAHAGHLALYVLMLAIPLSGWLMSSAKGFQTVWFGVLPIPDLLAKDKELGVLLTDVHGALNLIFIAVLVTHIGAALKHHFIDRDDILTRMLPRHSKEN
ncbi:cytochrome b [Lacisediminimonas profundi]|uniref:cytochrome b n=1 Tax=Lacisediminimonas profundi TaxID=2603856 RepID=UPI00124B7ABB|nr:cytochrome b [Lacisediminimonas profundi]